MSNARSRLLAPEAMPPLDVLDLPQLYTKPSAESLLETLALLTTAPPSWDHNAAEKESASAPALNTVNPEGVTRYLTSIVSSSLKWIADDDIKEEIWNQASQRLSERSGRTAMGALSRSFRIPTESGSFELTIHEPALTGDDLGLKTWAASYMLAKRLHTFQLPPVVPGQPLQVLELGSGTGLVGLAMAGLGANVVLTDLQSIHANLARNALDNSDVVAQSGGSTLTAVLDWTNPTVCEVVSGSGSQGQSRAIPMKFPLVLAADSLYSPEHPRMLVDTISVWLSEDSDARVIVEFPLRTAYMPEIEDFRKRMIKIGLKVLEEGEEQGYDDWGSSRADQAQDEDALVTCWWACWVRCPRNA